MEKTLPEGYQLHICHIDEDREMIFSEYVERDPWPETVGDLYRALQSEYGRCTSKVYIDGSDGRPVHVGWYFISRERYQDTGEPYLRGTWATVERRG